MATWGDMGDAGLRPFLAAVAAAAAVLAAAAAAVRGRVLLAVEAAGRGAVPGNKAVASMTTAASGADACNSCSAADACTGCKGSSPMLDGGWMLTSAVSARLPDVVGPCPNWLAARVLGRCIPSLVGGAGSPVDHQ